MINFDKASNELKIKIRSLMRGQVESIESRLIKNIGKHLNVLNIDKFIGLGDIIELGNMILTDVLKIGEVLEGKMLINKKIEREINFNHTIEYLQNIKLDDEIDYIENKKNLIEFGNLKSLTKNKNEDRYIIIGNSKDTFNSDIRNLVFDTIPVLKNDYLLNEKIKLFKDLLNRNIAEIESNDILKIIIESKNKNEIRYDTLFDLIFSELAGYIGGIELASPKEIYKNLLKIAILKDLDNEGLDSSDILFLANSLSKNVYKNYDLDRKFLDILETIDEIVLDGTFLSFDKLTNEILNKKINEYNKNFHTIDIHQIGFENIVNNDKIYDKVIEVLLYDSKKGIEKLNKYLDNIKVICNKKKNNNINLVIASSLIVSSFIIRSGISNFLMFGTVGSFVPGLLLAGGISLVGHYIE